MNYSSPQNPTCLYRVHYSTLLVATLNQIQHVRVPASQLEEPLEFYAHQSVHRESIFKNVLTRWHFLTVFYSLQAALHVSGETFTHHQELE
jgi:hypothetical protein